MYGFEITVTLSPDSLSARLDEITDHLADMCSTTDEFKGYMVTEQEPGGVTFLITADADNEVQALNAATSWLHSAVHVAGFATPGWLKSLEQVFDRTPASC